MTTLLEGVLQDKPVSGAAATYPECMRAAGWPVQAERDGGPRHALVWEVRGEFEDLLVEAARVGGDGAAIYREWFVYFRYPGHEDATFVDSPLGTLPTDQGAPSRSRRPTGGRWLTR